MLFALPLLIFGMALAETKTSVMSQLGKYSYEVDYFPEQAFQAVELGAGETDRLKKEPGYRDIYQRYLAYGAKAQIESVSDRRPASVTKSPSVGETLTYPVPQYPGLIAFKRGDLEASCPKVVQEAKALGADRIAYYHPVHFSGGNSSEYRMPENPKYGVHWRYEIANHFSQDEFERCLSLVSAAGLKIHYIPHLESVSALVSAREEWRMLSGIPIDDWYFHFSFGPLLTYLKKYPKNFRAPGAIDITLAAEIDPMVFADAKKVRAGKAWLQAKLGESGSAGSRYFINTNGDFFHGKELLKKKEIACSEVVKLFSEVDGLTPSMYGDKGHLKKKGGKLDLAMTMSTYREALRGHLEELCPTEKTAIAHLTSSVKIGFGEFAVDESDPEQSYRDILGKAKDELLFVQYWNHGKWDHLGILDSNTPALRQEIVTKKADKK